MQFVINLFLNFTELLKFNVYIIAIASTWALWAMKDDNLQYSWKCFTAWWDAWHSTDYGRQQLAALRSNHGPSDSHLLEVHQLLLAGREVYYNVPCCYLYYNLKHVYIWSIVLVLSIFSLTRTHTCATPSYTLLHTFILTTAAYYTHMYVPIIFFVFLKTSMDC